MELVVDVRPQYELKRWGLPALTGLCVTYLWLWLLTYGPSHVRVFELAPLDVVLEMPAQPEVTSAAPTPPPKSVKKVPQPAPPPRLLTQEPTTTPTEAAVPAPPPDLPAPQPAVAQTLDSGPAVVATEPAVAPAPRLNPVPISRLTRPPDFVQKVKPDDPRDVQLPLGGVRVKARITLDESATVRDIEIVTSGGAEFDAAVITAIRRSQFLPGYIGTRPVVTVFEQTYRFQSR